MKKRLSNKGFTLIELVVVIVIIAAIAGIIMVKVSNQGPAGRDARRMADMNQIRDAIEQFKANGGTCTIHAVDDATNDATKVKQEGLGLGFSGADKSTPAKYPSGYLSQGEYPLDPKSATSYYRILVTDGATCAYTIKAPNAEVVVNVPDVKG